jgi:hypothetical protein
MSWLKGLTGKESYEFGDISKAVFGRAGTAVSNGVAAFTGKEHYQFGDISRTIVTGVAGMSTSFFARHRADRQGAQQSLDESKDTLLVVSSVEEIWKNFFGACFDDGAAALTSGELNPEDVLDREVFFFIGLPARTLLGTCLRSLGRADDSFVLSSGAIVRREGVPQELLPLFTALAMVRAELSSVPQPLASEEVAFLQHETLFGFEQQERPNPQRELLSGPSRVGELHRVAGALQAIATQVTQLAFYKQNFDEILTELDILATARAATPGRHLHGRPGLPAGFLDAELAAGDVGGGSSDALLQRESFVFGQQAAAAAGLEPEPEPAVAQEPTVPPQR